MREKTHAHHHLKDDVPQDVKISRLTELNQVYRKNLLEMNRNLIGSRQLILLEGVSKKSDDFLYGRNEASQKVIVPKYCGDLSSLQVGDFVEVKINDCTSVTLIGDPVKKTTIAEFYS